MWLMTLLGVGLGLAFMPILTGGVAVIPLTRTNAASALNNVVQRVSGAMGLAVLTAILTNQRAEQLAGRAAIVPATTPTPHIGDASVPDWLSIYALYQQTQQLAFVGSIDDLFLIATGLSTLAALGALLLRSGPFVPSTAVGSRPPAQQTGPSSDGKAAADGHLALKIAMPGDELNDIPVRSTPNAQPREHK
jgi:hypothetical protein